MIPQDTPNFSDVFFLPHTKEEQKRIGILVSWQREGDRQYWVIEVIITKKPFTPEEYAELCTYIVKMNKFIRYADGYFDTIRGRQEASPSRYVVEPPQYPNCRFHFYTLGKWMEQYKLAEKIISMYVNHTSLKSLSGFDG